MRSNRSFHKIVMQIWKKQVWVFALSCLFFFLCCPVLTMMLLSGWEQNGVDTEAELVRYFTALFTGRGYGLADQMFPFVGALAAIAFISAWNGFSYLHDRRKTDFYHAQPLRREKWFAIQLLTALANYIIPAAAGFVLMLCIGGIRGLCTPAAAGSAVLLFLAGLVYYMLLYLTAVLAMLLTGKLLVGMLGTMVFLGICPTMIIAIQGYAGYFFTTKASGMVSKINLLRASALGSALDEIYERGESGFAQRLLLPLAATVILGIICMLIYRKRPSSSAEKSMAFKIPGEIILIVLTVTGALVMGLLFRSVGTYEDGWTVFGLLFGVLLLYAVIRMIYCLDIRRIFAGKIQLAAALVLTFAIAGIFRFDLFGYDSYLPKQDQINAIGFGQDAINTVYYYGYYERVANGIITLPCDDTTYGLLERLVSGHEIYESTHRDRYDAGSDAGAETCTVYIDVSLKNGMCYERIYQVYAEDVKDEVASLYDVDPFKKQLYGILPEDQKRIGEIRVRQPSLKSEDSWLEPSVSITGEKERKELVEAIRKDIEGISSATLDKEPVIGLIDLDINTTGAVRNEDGVLVFPEEDTDNEADSWPKMTRLGLCVYASYKQTLAVLEKYGQELSPLMDPDNVEKITLFDADGSTANEVTDKEKAAKMLPLFCPDDYHTMWQAGKKTARVILKDEDGNLTEYYGVLM